MNLLVLNQEYPPVAGGASHACASLCRELARRGHGVVVVTAGSSASTSRGVEDGVEVIRVAIPGTVGGAFTLRQLQAYAVRARQEAGRLLADRKIDRIHAFFSWPGGEVARRLSAVHGIPYIVSLRGSDVPGFRLARSHPLMRLATPRLRRVWSEARAVVANSEDLRILAGQTWGGPILCVPNGVEAERFQAPRRRRAADEPLRLLTVAQLIPRKRIDLVIALAAHLKRHIDRPVRLTVAGQGPLRDALRDQAGRLGVADVVEFRGPVAAEAMPALYAEADAFVLLSEHEGMSNAVLEAMASGLPVITTDTGGARDLLASGENGRIVDPSRPGWLDEAVGLLSDPKALARIGTSARSHVRRSCTWKDVAEAYEAVYQRPPPDRAVIFTDSRMAFAQDLTRATLDAVALRNDIRVTDVIDTGHRSRRAALRSYARRVAAWVIVRLFNPSRRDPAPMTRRRLARICRRHGLSLRYPPPGGLHDSAFLTWLRDPGGPDVALSLGCLIRFQPELLDVFDMAVNYHNGILPDYRGLRVTHWALYRGEPRVGFTFHRMDERLDTGPILLQDGIATVAVEPGWAAEDRKTAEAARRLPEVLDRIRDRDPGLPQEGKGTYFGRRRFKRLREVGDPGGVTLAELERRIRYFDWVWLDLDGRRIPVSRIVRSDRPSCFRFTTRDGMGVRAVRFRHLPWPLYVLLQTLR